jgi:type IV pilus assembly protein PilW
MKGFSLIEIMIAMSLSLVVTSGMIALMSVSLANTTRIIKMTKLTDDLRISMQMMSRDVRRSNYSANAINCFANPDCVADGTLSSPGQVFISEDNDCFVFRMDRNHDGDATENAAGGFRRVLRDGVGVLEMWVGSGTPSCAEADANWMAVTDPADITVTGFLVDDDLSYTEVVYDDGFGNQLEQKVRKVRMSISGQLVVDPSVQRTIEDVINLRNNLYL